MSKLFKNKFFSFFLIFMFLLITTFNLCNANNLEYFTNLYDKPKKIRLIVTINDKNMYNSYLKNSINKQFSTSKINSLKDEILSSQKNTKELIKKQCPEVKFIKSFTLAFNGFSMEINNNNIDKLKNIPTIKNIELCDEIKPLKNNPKKLDELKTIINSQDFKYKGSNIVVAVIDDGIDYTHKDLQMSDSVSTKLKKENITGKGKYFTNKVPYGYNFYDEDYDIKTNSDHGTGVAGIIGATGNPLTGGIKGLAPEVQLLALKVYSSSDKSTDNDVVLSAIEDAIYHQADIINISLGTTSLTNYSKAYEQLASVSDKLGIVFNVAAGNETASVEFNNASKVKDVGTMNTLFLGKGALIVGGCNNFNKNYFTMSIKSSNGELNNIPYEILHGNKDFYGEYNLVTFHWQDDSFKLTDELKNKLKNNILLLNGSTIDEDDIVDITYSTVKKLSPYAKSIILTEINRSFAEEVAQKITKDGSVDLKNYPIIYIKDKYENTLNNAIKNKSLLVFYEKNVRQTQNEILKAYSYSSIGPDDFLNFKPHILAPGEDIHTLSPDNGYIVGEGTSYATPYISGCSAILLNRLLDEGYIKNTRSEFSRFLVNHNLVNNGMQIFYKLKGGHNPLSSRVAGGGVVDMDSSLKSDVVITSTENQPYISLKQLNTSYRYFDIKIQNISHKDKKLKIYPYKVFSSRADWFVNIEESNSSVSFDKDIVNLKAKETITVKCKLNIDKSVPKENFIEGFIGVEELKDNSTEKKGRIGFMGYYGDWMKINIFDELAKTPNSIFNLTNIYKIKSIQRKTFTPSVILNDEIQVEKKNLSKTALYVSLLRNISSLEAVVFHEDKKTPIYTITKKQDFSKNYILEYLEVENNMITLDDPDTGALLYLRKLSYELKNEEPGKYYIRLRAVPHGYMDYPEYYQEKWIKFNLK